MLRGDYEKLWTETPGPADLLLVLEISDTTLEFDLTVKAGLYARAGIREYWALGSEWPTPDCASGAVRWALSVRGSVQ